MHSSIKKGAAFALMVSLGVAPVAVAVPAPVFAEDAAPSTAISIEGKEGTYASLAEAAKSAVDGDTILLPEGTFEGYRTGFYNNDPTALVNIKGVPGKTFIKNGLHFSLTKRLGEQTEKSVTLSGLTFIGNETASPWYGQTIRIMADGAEDAIMPTNFTLNVESCSFQDSITAISANGSKGIGATINVRNSSFDNVFCAIGAEFVNKYGQSAVKAGALTGNSFSNVEYQIQPFSMKQIYEGGSNNFYDTIGSFLADPTLSNPTYDGEGVSLTDGLWPAAVKDVSGKDHKYYPTIADALNDEGIAEKQLVLRDDVDGNDIVVPEGAKATIDFNGFDVAVDIVNNGAITLTNSKAEGGLAEGSKVVNNGTLDIDDDSIGKGDVEGDLENVAFNADYTALNGMIAKGAGLDKEDYTEESWSGFEKAMSDAKVMVDEAKASQEDVDAMTAALEKAMAGLEKKPELEPTPDPEPDPTPDPEPKPEPKPEPEPGDQNDGDKTDQNDGDKTDQNDGDKTDKGEEGKGETLPSTGDPAAMAGLMAAAGASVAVLGAIRRKR